jgi:TRAP-type C4-dicarboxylate transport system permease small subunit
MDFPSRPQTPDSPLAAVEQAFVRLNQWSIIALMGSMALLVFVNVLTRYLLNRSIIWVEELTQYEMIWIAYLGAGLALREGRHVTVDTLQNLLPQVARRWLRATLAVLMLAFVVVLSGLGFQLVAFTWNQETPVMNLPTGLPYLAVPVGAVGFGLHLLMFWRDFVERRFEQPDDASGMVDDELLA